MKRTIRITRKNFEKIKDVFEKHDINEVFFTESHDSGIGPAITLEFTPKKITVDITDVESW